MIFKKNNTFFSQIIFLLNITVLLAIGLCFLLTNYHVAALSSISVLIICFEGISTGPKEDKLGIRS